MTDQPPGGLLRTIVGTLETLGIRYMVVGSFASTAYGEPRSTRPDHRRRPADDRRRGP